MAAYLLKSRYSQMPSFHSTGSGEWGGNPVDINNLYNILPKVEVIIGGTQAEVNLLSEEALENSNCPRAQFALQAGSPKLFIDFGMPRNFNPNLKAYENVSL